MRYLLLLFPLLIFSSVSQTPHIAEPRNQGDQPYHYTKPFEVFPNPAEKYFQLKSEYFSGVPTELSVFDVSGKVVIQLDSLTFNEENISHVDVSFLSSGLYFIKLRTGNYSATKKIFKI